MSSAIDRTFVRLASTLLFLLLVASPLAVRADDSEPADFFGALKASKPILHATARWEYGKADGLEHSHGATLRTRFGLQTGAYRGFSALVEGVNTISPFSSEYFDAQAPNSTGQTPVADPERTDVNRYWLRFADESLAGVDLKAGRQRIKLDDDRWIGNVGWRQNEQTFDAARFQTTLGLENVLVQYIYTWEVNRIFANEGAAGQLDFDPNAHFVNVGWSAGKALKAVAFVYLIDPDAPAVAAFGSATYGARFTGAIPVSEDWSLPYQASYAWQSDWGRNETSYDAHYVYAEAGVKRERVGRVSVGYELLGSDTDAVVVTPFSTAHKFNGFADVFLNNGGTRGLRDLYVTVAPAIPLARTKLALTFHQFWDDQGGDDLGQEYDLVTSWALNEHLSFLWKVGYFDGGKRRSPPTTTRSIVQATLKF